MTRMFLKSKKLPIIKILIIFILISINFKNVALPSTFSEEQTINITKNLRCLICQGQTIHESNSDFAESMKKYIKSELENGKTNEEIFSSLVKKYGQWIVYDPGQEKQIMDYLKNNPEAQQQLSGPIFEDKIIDFVLELANVNEKTVSIDELYKEDEMDLKKEAKKGKKSNKIVEKNKTKKVTKKVSKKS